MQPFFCISYIEMQMIGRCGSIQYKDFRVYRTCWFTPGVAEVYSWVRNDSGIRSLLSSTYGSLTTVLWQIKIAGSTLTACIMIIPNFHGCEEWKIYHLLIRPLPASLSFFPSWARRYHRKTGTPSRFSSTRYLKLPNCWRRATSSRISPPKRSWLSRTERRRKNSSRSFPPCFSSSVPSKRSLSSSDC